MPIVTVVAAVAAALIHLWFFALESVLFSPADGLSLLALVSAFVL